MPGSSWDDNPWPTPPAASPRTVGSTLASPPPPPGAAGPGAKPPVRARQRRRRWPRRLVIGLCCLVAFLLLVAGATYGYLRYRLGQVHRVQVATLQPAASGPFNVLLVGADGQGGGERADTMIVARIDPLTGRASLLSIPYDYFAPIAGSGQSNKISDALDGGPSRMVATVEQDLGIPISHYIQVSFQGVVKIVNALGGVRLDFPYPARDTMSGLNVPVAGCQTLDGTQALALVRSRFYQYEKDGTWYEDPTGAFGRIRRQQAFLRALVQRVEHSLLSDPLRLNAFIGATVHDVTVDQGLGVGTIVQLAQAFRHLGTKELDTYTLPTQIVNNDGPYGDVLYPVPTLDASTIQQWEQAVAPHRTAASTASTPSSGSSTVSGGTDIATPPPPQAPRGSLAIVSGTVSYDPTPC
ncbi:LCP family protein [Aciditerrimonas ferrireducens]|uniref:LCP family protein n=1 Tax=Aciditerrimonas ferrireducens TaxID=667306 RepID=UPI0020044623|nr:LCP family protein [Aciditerrimonas ferrireducens]MCK4176901.1 LCP family protein [Aciditerrimonas ferrireducens]